MVAHGASDPPRLPMQQLAILAVCRLSEPIALTSFFPYLPEMIESFNVEKKNVAKWAGIIGSAFSFAQFLTAILWGRASDVIGRKTTMLLGLTVTMICTLLLGFSQSLPWALACRTFAGAGNGNIGIIRTMVAEMVPEKELQPRAFSIMPLVWNFGSILGPAFGGLLAKPATNLPGLFGGNKFLIRFPFVLPNLVAVMFFTSSIIVGLLFLKETLHARKNKPDYGIIAGEKLIQCIHGRNGEGNSEHDDDAETPLLHASSATPSNKASNGEWRPRTKPALPPPGIKDVFTTQSTLNLICYAFLACTSMAWDQTVPIFMHTPVQIPDKSNTQLPFKFSGGFGLDSGRIGTIFTLYGIVGGVVQFLVFPPLARRYGVLNCFKFFSVGLPLVCFSTPYTALIMDPVWQQLVMFGIMVVKSICIIFAFPCSTILLTNSAKSLRVLGTLNGVATSVAAIGRALGPLLTGSTFTWGLGIGYVVTPWFILGTISAIGVVPIWWLEESEGFDSDDEEVDEDEEAISVDDEGTSAAAVRDELVAVDEEAIDVVDGPPLSRYSSRTGPPPVRERRMSTPIGLTPGSFGPGMNRRLSTGLGVSNYGRGTGGTAFD